jgi:hypothetical protein
LVVVKVLGFVSVDDGSASIIGMSPIIFGCEVNYELMDMDALHAYKDSWMVIIQLVHSMMGLYQS